MKIFIITTIFTAFFLAEGVFAWPVVESYHRTIQLMEAKNPGKVCVIKDVFGKPVYLFEAFINAYNFADEDYDYTGIFEFTIIPLYDSNVWPLLLNSGADRTWDSRARMLPEDFAGTVQRISRKFNFRNTELILNIKKWKLEPNNKQKEDGYDTRMNEIEFDLDIFPVEGERK